MPFPEIAYNPKAGRYIYTDTKRFVPQAVIRNLVDNEQQQLGVRLQALTRLLENQTIALSQWQQRFAQTLKDSHLRMLTLGAGSKDGLSARHYGIAGYELRKQYDYLNRLAEQIFAGKVTIAQALQRSRQYSISTRVTFAKSEQVTRIAEGFTEACRLLDPQAAHCDDCLSYAARGWVLSDQLPVPGMACACGQMCRCSIIYRKSPGGNSRV